MAGHGLIIIVVVCYIITLTTHRYVAVRVERNIQIDSTNVSSGIDQVPRWMSRLQLNTSKTEVIWFATSHRQSPIPTSGFSVWEDVILPVHSVYDLGSFIDLVLMTASHVTNRVSRCFATLRQLCRVSRFLWPPMLFGRWLHTCSSLALTIELQLSPESPPDFSTSSSW